MERKEYDELAEPLLSELSDAARWISETRQRVMIVFEGRDTAGKGGSINAFAATLNPRQCRTVALSAPNERERTQWYFQRYIEHLPAAGELVLFDRSWYNRAGVEPVMGYCTAEQTTAFLKTVPMFEKELVDDGILLFKYWLCCDQDNQEERFEARLKSSTRRWKLSPVDLKARTKYEEYTDAREAMLEATHTDYAPWTLVDFNDQSIGRLTLIRDLLDRLPDTKLPMEDIPWPPLDGEPRKERFKLLQPLPSFDPDAPPEAAATADADDDKKDGNKKHKHKHKD